MENPAVSFTEQIDLGCQPDDVFWHMIDPKTAPTVDPTIVEWLSEDFPPRVGTLNRLTAKGPFGLRLKVTSQFIEFDPPRRMVLAGMRPFAARWVRATHDLDELPGGMRYTYTVEMRPPLGFRLWSRLVARMMRRGVREGSQRLLRRFGAPLSET